MPDNDHAPQPGGEPPGIRLARQSDRQGRIFAETIANSIRDGLLVLTPDLRVETANTAFYRTFHVQPEDTEDRLVFDLGNGQWDIPRLRELLERLLPEQEVISNFEVTHDFEDLGMRTMRFKAEQLDPMERIILIIEDITEERRLREASEAAIQERYQTLFNTIDEGFCVIEVLFDDEGRPDDCRFLEANPAFEEQTGLRNAVGKRVRELVPELERHWFDMYGRVATTGRSTRFTHHAKDLRGGTWYDVHAFRIGDPDEHVVAVVFHDVTERQRSEEEIRSLNARLESLVAQRTEQLTRANQELDAFNYSVSHDLRAPLRGVDGFAAALLEECGEQLNAAGRHYLERVRAGTQRMRGLIDDLLRLSHISRSDVRMREVDLTAVAREIVAGLQERDPERRVDVRIEEGMVVQGDEGLLAIALENLLANSWKFTSDEEHARIEVGMETEKDGGRAVFVRDNGVGFDPAYEDKLFTPFQRLHSDARFPGSGIGLTMVQRIVHLHGGRVEAEGIPGDGAVFRLTLPST